MSSFREKMRKGRIAIHQGLSVPAVAFPEKSPSSMTDISVRVHDNYTQLGKLKGTSFHYAEVEDNTPRIIFMRSEIEPYRGLIVMISQEEGYYVDTILPPDDITVTARVSRMLAEDIFEFPFPGKA